MERAGQDDGAQPRRMLRPGGRTERVRKQVVAATVELLAEDGVAGISVEAVARRSEVARTTIYRRWGTPESLMLEALREELGPRARRMVDTGTLRGDLTALLQDITAFAVSDQGRGVLGALFVQRSSPAIATETRLYWAQRFEASGEIVRRAIGRGELPAGTPERLIMEMAAAPLYLRLFMTQDTVDEPYLDSVVEFVLTGCRATDPEVRDRALR